LLKFSVSRLDNVAFVGPVEQGDNQFCPIPINGPADHCAIGSDDFMAWFSALDLRSVAARLKAEFTVNAHTAYVAMRKALTRKILMVTGLPRQTVRSMGMEPVESAGEAVERARGILGRLEDVIVLPMASVTVPLPAWRPAEGGGA